MDSTLKNENNFNNLVCFDGVCSICNGWVNFLIKRDHQKILRYTPLQNERISKILIDFKIDPREIDTMIFIKDGIAYKKSNAILEILKTINYFSGAIFLLRMFPLLLRDFFYNLIAPNRYRISSKKDSCRIPTPEERDLFID